MERNYNELLKAIVNDTYRIIYEAEENPALIKYFASIDVVVAEHYYECNDITSAIIYLVTDDYIKVNSEDMGVNCIVREVRKNIKKLTELIVENLSIRELVMEVYGCCSFGKEIMECLDNGYYEDVIGLMLIEEIINC